MNADARAAVRRYFSPALNEVVTDEVIDAALEYFGRDSHRLMLAARYIVRSREPVNEGGDAK